MSGILLKRHQFRVMHLLVITLLAAVWLALFRLGGVVQLLLVFYSYALATNGIQSAGRYYQQRWLELVGSLAAVMSLPFAIGYLHWWAPWW